jgi:hypothetical protein
MLESSPQALRSESPAESAQTQERRKAGKTVRTGQFLRVSRQVVLDTIFWQCWLPATPFFTLEARLCTVESALFMLEIRISKRKLGVKEKRSQRMITNEIRMSGLIRICYKGR